MVKEVVYTPISKDIKVNAPTRIETPSYPDKGVTFAGYSKTLYGGGQYRLNPQQELDANMSISWLLGETYKDILFSTYYKVMSGKKFYVTDVIIQTISSSVLGNEDLMSIKSGTWSNGDVKIRLIESLSNNNTEILHFSVPLEFDDQFSIGYDVARSAPDFCLVNFYGWVE